MADKATTDTATAEQVAASDIAASGSPDTATPPAKPATAPAAAKATTGRTSGRRNSKGDKESPETRFEEYISYKPDGNGGHTEVTVRRNIDTGASEIVDG